MSFRFTNPLRAAAGSRRVALATLLVAGLAGCSSLAGLGKTPEEIVAARAEARWRAVIAGDWEAAYHFSTPSFRSAVPLAGYMNMLRSVVTRKDVAVREVKCADGACEAKIRLFFVPPMSKGVTLDTEVSERWIEDGGIWYIYTKN